MAHYALLPLYNSKLLKIYSSHYTHRYAYKEDGRLELDKEAIRKALMKIVNALYCDSIHNNTDISMDPQGLAPMLKLTITI